MITESWFVNINNRCPALALWPTLYIFNTYRKSSFSSLFLPLQKKIRERRWWSINFKRIVYKTIFGLGNSKMRRRGPRTAERLRMTKKGKKEIKLAHERSWEMISYMRWEKLRGFFCRYLRKGFGRNATREEIKRSRLAFRLTNDLKQTHENRVEVWIDDKRMFGFWNFAVVGRRSRFGHFSVAFFLRSVHSFDGPWTRARSPGRERKHTHFVEGEVPH